LFEPFFELRDPVTAGQVIGQIHSQEQPFNDPFPIHARTSGMIISRRSFPLVRQGEYLATVVRPFSL
jgi:predicted deacylase